MSEPAARRLRRLAGVLSAVGTADPIFGLCRAAVPVLAVSGASLMLRTGEVPAPLAWSDELAERLEDLQTTLGVGPCIEAQESGRSVSEPDLDRPADTRWLEFSRSAREVGAVAIFSFPLRIGAARLGALTVYRPVAGELSDRQHADAQVIADIAASAILASQARSPDEVLGPDLEVLVHHGAAIHQASGMVSVQLGLPIVDAMVRLRARAFASDAPLGAVAAEVLEGRLRFDDRDAGPR